MSKKTALTIAALIAAQALMYLAWRVVESGRSPSPDLAPTGQTRGAAEVLTTRLNTTLPDLQIRRADGATATLREALSAGEGSGDAPRIVHVWATWCPPCREELPGLFAYGDTGEVSVLAVSVDPGWEDVRALLGEEPRDEVALASGERVRDALGVRALPVTFVVDEGGTIRLRLDGARDWADPELRAEVAAVR